MTTTYISGLAIDPVTTNTIYATSSSTSSGGIFQSTDGGGSWSTYSSGLDPMTAKPIAIDPATPSRLYAGTFGGGIFRQQ